MIDTEKLTAEYEQMNDTSFTQVDSAQPDYWRETELNDDVSCDDSESVSSQISKSKQTKIKTRFSELNKNDRGFFKLKLGRKNASVTGFSTSYFTGATIRNASTGYFESDYMGKPVYKVGSEDEDLFFRVSLAVNGMGSDPRKLFYDNPEQFERHFSTTVSNETKRNWADKYDIALKRDQRKRQVAEQPQYTTVN